MEDYEGKPKRKAIKWECSDAELCGAELDEALTYIDRKGRISYICPLCGAVAYATQYVMDIES